MNANIDMEIVGSRFLSKIPTSLRKIYTNREKDFMASIFRDNPLIVDNRG
jgi:hypothetical protein